MAENLDIRKGISLGIIFAFLLNTFGPVPLAQAQDYRLPAPGVMVHLSPEFNPPILKGIRVHPDNPFRFDFILDRGDSQLSNAALKEESSKLIKYFLASLTIPEKDLWVNLSPYEKDRIIPNSFGLTEMGRDLLAEDYMLKQITASLIYPEDEIGKKFWKRIYEEAYKKFGTTNIPVNTFNKVWIVPSKAVVYENAKTGTAFVVESKLKVMLEQDYLALNKNTDFKTTSRSKQWDQLVAPEVSALGSQVVREIVIPQLTKEVNEDKNFAHLRQVYNSLILATWYKKKIKDSILEQVYANKNKVAGVNIDDPREKERIYQRYLQAFKKGVFNYIKEDAVSTPGMPSKEQGIFPRKYFSGGEDLDLGVTDVNPNGVLDVRESMPSQAIILDTENQKNLFTISEETAAAENLKSADHAMFSRSRYANVGAIMQYLYDVYYAHKASAQGSQYSDVAAWFSPYVKAGLNELELAKVVNKAYQNEHTDFENNHGFGADQIDKIKAGIHEVMASQEHDLVITSFGVGKEFREPLEVLIMALKEMRDKTHHIDTITLRFYDRNIDFLSDISRQLPDKITEMLQKEGFEDWRSKVKFEVFYADVMDIALGDRKHGERIIDHSNIFLLRNTWVLKDGLPAEDLDVFTDILWSCIPVGALIVEEFGSVTNYRVFNRVKKASQSNTVVARQAEAEGTGNQAMIGVHWDDDLLKAWFRMYVDNGIEIIERIGQDGREHLADVLNGEDSKTQKQKKLVGILNPKLIARLLSVEESDLNWLDLKQPRISLVEIAIENHLKRNPMDLEAEDRSRRNMEENIGRVRGLSPKPGYGPILIDQDLQELAGVLVKQHLGFIFSDGINYAHSEPVYNTSTNHFISVAGINVADEDGSDMRLIPQIIIADIPIDGPEREKAIRAVNHDLYPSQTFNASVIEDIRQHMPVLMAIFQECLNNLARRTLPPPSEESAKRLLKTLFFHEIGEMIYNTFSVEFKEQWRSLMTTPGTRPFPGIIAFKNNFKMLAQTGTEIGAQVPEPEFFADYFAMYFYPDNVYAAYGERFRDEWGQFMEKVRANLLQKHRQGRNVWEIEDINRVRELKEGGDYIRESELPGLISTVSSRVNSAMMAGQVREKARDQAMQASRLILTTSNKIAHQDKTLESRQELAGDIQRVLQTRNINSPVWLFGSSALRGLRSFHDVDIAVGNSVEENHDIREAITNDLILRIERRGKFYKFIHGVFLLSNLRALDEPLRYGIVIRITRQGVQEIRDYSTFLRLLHKDELGKSSLSPMEIHHESEDRAMTGPNQEGDESASGKKEKAAGVPIEDETENSTKEGVEDLTGHSVGGKVNIDLGPLTRKRISWARGILDLPASNFPNLDEDVILWARLNKLMALKPGDPDASLKLEEEIELAAALLIRSLSNQARGAQPEVAGDQAMQTTSRVFKSKAVERLWKDLRKGAIPGELPTKFKGRTEQSIADEYGVSQSRVSALITGVIGEEYAGKGRRRKEMPREAGDRAMKEEVNLNRLEIPIHVLKDMPNPGDIAYETYTYLDMHNWLMNESAGFGNKVVKVRFRREADGGFIIEEIDNDTDKYAGILPPGAKTREVEINHVSQEKAYDGGKVTTTEIKIKEIELKDGRILEVSPNDELLATIKDSDRIFYFEQVKDYISGKVTGRWQEKDSLVLTNMQEAIRNGWTTQDVVPRELSLDTIDQKEGISVTDIGLIRRMKFNQMKNGVLMTSEHRQDGGWKRGTLHFSGNHPVVENPNASWENEEATVIIPLYKVQKSRIENFNLVDTWVRGDLELPEGSVVIGQKPLPENVNLGKAVYKIVPQDRISIEKFIGELGYTVTEGNWWAWSPETQWNRYGAEFAEKEGLHYGVHFHSEAERREYELNAKNSTERTEKGTYDAMAAFKKGGIDLTPANMHLQIQNNGGAIKFHMDPAMLKQLQSALGFVPVIINIQPMNNLREFLGLKQPAQSNVG